MYEAFYRLRARPFSIAPDPGYMYFSRRHRIALNMLEYGLGQAAGFCVVTGPIGTGKTTLIRFLLGRTTGSTRVGLIANLHTSPGSLLPRVLLAFRLEAAGASDIDRLHALSGFIEGLAASGKRAVLIIDEAQGLSPAALEELRLLSNISSDLPVLQTVLVGQPALKKKLQLPELEQLAQRVVVDYELLPLDRQDTGRYIAHRLLFAGGDGQPLFDEAACDAIHHYSGGVPRVINILCETALVYGYADRKPRIDAALVNDVASDRQRGGILPLQGGRVSVA